MKQRISHRWQIKDNATAIRNYDRHKRGNIKGTCADILLRRELRYKKYLFPIA